MRNTTSYETQVSYTNMVTELVKSGKEISESLSTAKLSLLMEALQQGVSVGNYVDAVKKQVMYNKPAELVADVYTYVPQLTPLQCAITHMSMGILGEAAEVMEVLVDHVLLDQPLDKENIIEELGDIEFYLEGLRQAIGVSRAEILDVNVAKLRTRYKSGYSDQAAQNRVDKA